MIKEISKIGNIYELLPIKILSAVKNIPEVERNKIWEIRLRLDRKLSAAIYSKEYFIEPDGRLSSFPDNAVTVNKEDMVTVYERAFRNSIHSYQREITEGYITVSGGNRMGFCGTAVLDPQKNFRTETVKNISSINLRIAREVIGSGEKLFEKVFCDNIKSLLIVGPPACGKTTVLRDLTRLIGNRYRVSLIDERNEIGASVNGCPQNDIGFMTDVFTSYSKYDGIMTAVKVMSPDIIICDEIGSKSDLDALEYMVNSGVKLVATCHGASIDEAKKRNVINKLVKSEVFDCFALLGTGALCGKITSFSLYGGKHD